jgi:hypothetical protein
LCVDGSGAGASSQCYNNVPWTGGRLPVGVTHIVASPGLVVPIDFALSTPS